MRKMKNSLWAALASALILCWTASTGYALSIGYIDIQKVFSSYKKTIRFQEQSQQKEKALQDEITAKQKQFEKEKNKGTSEIELRKLAEKYEKEIEPQRNEMMNFQQKTVNEIKIDIVKATEDVAKKMGMDIVLDKQVFITGGTDISDKVIDVLNGK
jgi:Skp family chaperone for outer membrane proteins